MRNENASASHFVSILYRHGAAWMLATCWVAAAGWLLAGGHGIFVLLGAGASVVGGLLCMLTASCTEDPPGSVTPPPRERVCLWIQLVPLAIVVLLTGWAGLHLHHAVDKPWQVPGWSDAESWFGRLGERHLSPAWVGNPYLALANPARYCLLPLLFLVPLTGLRHLGVGPGHRVFRVIGLWCALPLAVVAYSLATGGVRATEVAARLLGNTLSNGPFEEFLFRGAIQTRLVVLLGPRWGVVLASLLFGIWHLGLGYAQTGGRSLWDGLASTVILQTMVGLVLGVIYHRTRNLIAPSVCHVVFNSIG